MGTVSISYQLPLMVLPAGFAATAAIAAPLQNRTMGLEAPAPGQPDLLTQGGLTLANELPTMFLRGMVTATSLAVGQLALGEKDSKAILARSITGAIVTEGSALGLRAAHRLGSGVAEDRVLLGWMASYGPSTFERRMAMYVAARAGRPLR